MSTFSELIDFTRSSTGTYLDSVVYGDELVQSTTQSGVISSTNNDPYLTVENLGQVSISNDVLTFNNTQWESVRRNVGMEIGKYYKVSFTVNVTSGNVAVYKNGATNIGNFTTGTHSVIYKQEAAVNLQFSSGGFVGTVSNVSVVEVISTAGGTPLLRTADTNEPRLEYDASGQPLGLLIEEQRSNILHQSEDFQNAYWGKVGIATSPSGSVTPDGLGNATLLFAIGTSGAYVARSNLGSAGQGYTASVFAKAGTHDIIRISNQSSGTSGGWFDLTNGTTLTENGANNKSFIQYVGNGWYKCSRYFDSWVNTNNSLLFGVSASDGSTQSAVGDTVSLWGAQLELGAFPTSYIPTSGSTVTRNQDVCRIEKEKYHLHQKKGTIYCEFDAITSTVETNLEYQRIYELATTDSDDRVTAWIKNDDGTLTSQVYDNNVSQAGYPLEVGYNDKVNTIKVATAYGVNHFQASNDGKVGGIDSSVTLDYPRYRLAIMQRTTTGSPLCGHMKRITYTPKVLTGAQLIELTKPSSSPTMSLTFDGQATSELVEGLHD